MEEIKIICDICKKVIKEEHKKVLVGDSVVLINEVLDIKEYTPYDVCFECYRYKISDILKD